MRKSPLTILYIKRNGFQTLRDHCKNLFEPLGEKVEITECTDDDPRLREYIVGKDIVLCSGKALEEHYIGNTSIDSLVKETSPTAKFVVYSNLTENVILAQKKGYDYIYKTMDHYANKDELESIKKLLSTVDPTIVDHPALTLI